MNKFIYIGLFILFGASLSAQNVKWIKKSNDPVQKRFSTSYVENSIIQLDEGGAFLSVSTKHLKDEIRQVDMIKYQDKNFKEIKTVSMKIENSVSVFYIGQKAYLLSNKAHSFFAQVIDPQTLELGEAKEIFSSQKLKNKWVDFRISPDKSKILFQTFKGVKPKEHNEIEVFVLDQNLNKLWTKHIKLKNIDQLTDFGYFIVGNDGEYCFTTTEYKVKKKAILKGKINFTTKLYTYSDNGETFQKFVFKSGKLLLSLKGKIWSPRAGQVNFTTFYSTIPKKKNFLFDGIVVKQINLEDGSVDTKKHPFTKELAFIGSEGWVKKQKKIQKRLDDKQGILPEMTATDIIFSAKTGNAVIAFENRYSYLVDGRYGRSTEYHFEDILCVQLDKEGNLNWMKDIHKHQLGSDNRITDRQRASYYLHYDDDDNVYFLFNDIKSNLKSRINNKKVANYNSMRNGKSGLMALKIDSNGKMSEKLLKSKAFIEPVSSSFRLNGKTCIITGNNKSKFLGLVTFP